jgi:catechol 2,3-dioxygenase-like lactoylglutathione lyase family enzyme
MKRFHIHVSVDDIAQSIRFYSTLFGTEPSRVEADYAKWLLEDPRLNFAISTRRRPAGVDHLGFQVESAEELRGMHAQLTAADARLIQEDGQACCYARSDKYWVTDPTGIAWETFHTLAAARSDAGAAADNPTRPTCRPGGGAGTPQTCRAANG